MFVCGSGRNTHKTLEVTCQACSALPCALLGKSSAVTDAFATNFSEIKSIVCCLKTFHQIDNFSQECTVTSSVTAYINFTLKATQHTYTVIHPAFSVCTNISMLSISNAIDMK